MEKGNLSTFIILQLTWDSCSMPLLLLIALILPYSGRLKMWSQLWSRVLRSRRSFHSSQCSHHLYWIPYKPLRSLCLNVCPGRKITTSQDSPTSFWKPFIPNITFHFGAPIEQFLCYLCSCIISNCIDSGCGHVLYYGKWDISKCNASRSFISACTLDLVLWEQTLRECNC